MAKVSISAGIIAIAALFSLHFLSPELDPSWHMVSEYAYGSFGWVLTIFFLGWGVSSWATAATLLPFSKSIASKIGVFFLFIAGLGAIMGAVFDVRHSLHGTAFAIGVPTLPIAALILSVYLARTYQIERKKLLVFANATWVSLVIMAITMAIFISGLKAVGAFHPEAPVMLTSLPKGVVALIGYTNRLLVLAYIAWLIVVSHTAIKIYRKSSALKG